MSSTKLFALVFASVLLANLVTLALVRLWDRYPTASLAEAPRVPTFAVSVPAPATSLPPAALPTLGTTLPAAFKNATEGNATDASAHNLNCEMVDGGEYKRFLFLAPGGLKGFNALPQDANIRCDIQLGAGATTMLTYFVLKTPGTYELSLSRVPCSSCTNQDWRWATVVVDPSGHSDYTHFK